VAENLDRLFANNRAWVERVTRDDPDFFERLKHQQQPDVLWIGCSDSRVPANQITGLLPGEVFVHRNVANVVVHTDLNCLSTIQFAVEVLRVRHIVVCGHYGCGGVRAALFDERLGLVDNWLRHVADVRDAHAGAIAKLARDEQKWRFLCELNVMAQVVNAANTTVVQDAWARGHDLDLHGWIYDVADGLLRDLAPTGRLSRAPRA